MDLLDKREKYYAFNSLSAIPLSLIGKSVLIDLRNETSVAGRIESADGFMNITLNEVVFIDQKGHQYEFDDFMVPARNLRQIHIPDNIDMNRKLSEFFASGKRNKEKRNTKTFKVKRAERKHNEILQEIGKSVNKN